jgi:hypothetical protein
MGDVIQFPNRKLVPDEDPVHSPSTPEEVQVVQRANDIMTKAFNQSLKSIGRTGLKMTDGKWGMASLDPMLEPPESEE